MLKLINIIIVSMVGLLGLVACDKDRPYDVIQNKEGASGVQTKGLIDHLSQRGKHVINPATGQEFSLSTSHKIPLDKQYLAVVSTTSIDKDAPVTPYEMGREVRTVLTFTEDNLVAFEIPNQYDETELNFKPFLKIPVSHIDYKCAEDANGKCTQKEIVDTEKTWVDKKYYVPSFDKASLESLDGLFSTLINYAIGCSSELESRVISYKIEKSAINITLEKTMRQNFSCAGMTALFNPSEVTYRMRQNISLVKLSTLVSPDYEPLEYQLAGPNEFGYFRTVYTQRDSANRVCADCRKEFVSRWNPKKKVIDFYLSSHFDKPANATLKSATYHGIGLINEAFKDAGTDMQIKLHDNSPKNIEGDIRKNLIVMVEDPISRGLLGYGPSITNPMTGEIIHARTVMFPGIMRLTIERAYGEYQQLIVQKEQDKIDAAKSIVGTVVGLPDGLTGSQKLQLNQSLLAFKDASKIKSISVDQSTLVSNAGKVINKQIQLPDHQHLDDSRIGLLDKYFHLHEDKSIELKEELEELTKRNYYPAELFNVNGAMGEIIEKLVKSNDYLPWDRLSSAQKENVINKLLPVVWVPTLIHEIGHNLGLRHNFNGSNDKDNFFTKEELLEKGIDREMKYSSIMDYSYSSANELSVMGKYDIAALRFAYAEKMETLTGEMIPIDAQVSPDAIKPYMFCTDEGVSLNATCNRFDEGTTYLEIVQNVISDYEKNYVQRNFKRDRYSFNSTSGDVVQISRLNRSMTIIRTVFELYEEIATDFKDQLEADPTQWETNEFLKDLKGATVTAGQFLINIVQTPDVHCLIAQETEGGLQLAAIVQLKQLSDSDSTCFTADLADTYLAVGQAGKSFNHIRDRRNPLAFIDEIDVRGVWIDKMLALKTLLQRSSSLGNFDNKVKNMISVPELKEPIMTMLTNITSDNFNGVLTFDTLADGPMPIPWDYSLFKEDTHKLNQHFHPGVRRYFGLKRSGPTVFQSLAIKEAKKYAWHDQDRDLGQELFDTFNVHSILENGQEEKDIVTYKIGNNIMFAYPSNIIARETISKIDGIDQMQKINELIAKTPELEDRMKEVIESRKAGAQTEPIESMDDFDQLLYTADLELLEDNLNGQLLPKVDFYELILEDLLN